MAQQNIWEREYSAGHLMTSGDVPQPDTLDFLRFARKEKKITWETSTILDLGCGTGRNANYIAEDGATVIGIEIATNALELAKVRAKQKGVTVTYIHGSIGESFPVPDTSVDVILDVMSSNSLTEAERAVYLKEMYRVLKPQGLVYIKALCKDGDQNAKNLIKEFPGPEQDTYVMPEIGLVERIWSETDFRAYYGDLFTIERLEKKTNYSKFNNQSYKRNFWLAYLSKK